MIQKIQLVPHRKYYVSATKVNRSAMFKKAVDVYCGDHTKHTDALCGRKAESFSTLKLVVYVEPLDFKGLLCKGLI
jgi:hypothetical protein